MNETKPPHNQASRKNSKEWNQDMWETYFEMLESPQTELLFDDGAQVERIDHQQAMRKLWAFEPGLPPAEAKAVIRALDELPYLEKDMVLQYFWDGRTVREIARNLERSHMFVWRRLQQALVKLKGLLGQSIPSLKSE